MARPIVLHQMTAMPVSPDRLPALAASIGCKAVSLFTYTPDSGLPEENAGFSFPLVTDELRESVQATLRDNDVSVSGVEFFPIAADIDVEDFVRSLALGRELGARRAVTLVFDDNPARALDKLGRLCDLAAAQELSLGLEFTPLTRGCVSLQQAVWYVDQIGGGKLGIGVDTLHLVRSGGTAADIRALDGDYFRYAQICDGIGIQQSADYFAETHNRELPGLGDFPLRDILGALPASIPLEVEVPSEVRWEAGVTAEQHARDAVNRTRTIVETLT